MEKEVEMKVDVEKLDTKKLDEISNLIGEKIKTIVDKSIEDVNKILNTYKMEAKMQISIEKQEE